MPTITIRLSDDEKKFIERMAELNGLTVSKISRDIILEKLEDQIDLETYNQLIALHHEKDESISHEEMKKELFG